MAALYLYHVKRTDRGDYDSYSDFVVCAESEQEARTTYPSGGSGVVWSVEQNGWLFRRNDEWTKITFGLSWTSKMENIQVRLVGQAIPPQGKGIICSSFHAG